MGRWDSEWLQSNRETYTCQNIDFTARLFTHGLRNWLEEIDNKHTRCHDKNQQAPHEEKKIARDCKQHAQTYHHSKVGQISPKRSWFLVHWNALSCPGLFAGLLLLFSCCLSSSSHQWRGNSRQHHCHDKTHSCKLRKNIAVSGQTQNFKKHAWDATHRNCCGNQPFFAPDKSCFFAHWPILLDCCVALVYSNVEHLNLSSRAWELACGCVVASCVAPATIRCHANYIGELAFMSI
jgi:hypothetical protein